MGFGAAEHRLMSQVSRTFLLHIPASFLHCFADAFVCACLWLQLCWEMGFPCEDLAASFADDESPILDFYPELGHWRDIVFSFKFLMNPNMKSFPSHTEAWDHNDARLRWT